MQGTYGFEFWVFVRVKQLPLGRFASALYQISDMQYAKSSQHVVLKFEARELFGQKRQQCNCKTRLKEESL